MDIDLTDATDAAARALAGLKAGEDWPTNEALGGNPTGTRDDEFRDGMLDQAADAVLAAAPLIEAAVRAQIAQEQRPSITEWGVRHSQGTRTEYSEESARKWSAGTNHLNKHRYDYERRHKTTVVRREVTDWYPADEQGVS